MVLLSLVLLTILRISTEGVRFAAEAPIIHKASTEPTRQMKVVYMLRNNKAYNWWCRYFMGFRNNSSVCFPLKKDETGYVPWAPAELFPEGGKTTNTLKS